LDLVLDEVTARFKTMPIIRILAFSQGVATAIRWTLNSKIQTTDVLLWGGVFPPDVDFESQRQRLTDLNLRIVVGEQDEFYQDERRNKLHEALDEHKIPFVLSVVPGKHDIDQAAWQALSNP
jgi:predicted esterase